MQTINICWFRRDLRLEDNAALYHSLKSNHAVVPIFIFDKNILDDLEDKADRRVEFIHGALKEMQVVLEAMGSSLEVYYGFPIDVFRLLQKKYSVEKVFANHDYEPYAVSRDSAIENLLKQTGASFHTYKDQVIFEKNEVMKEDGSPYSIFTPYSRRWKATINDLYLKSYPVKKYYSNFFKQPAMAIPSLERMGFVAVDKPFPAKGLNEELLKKYKEQRDFPAIHGTSRLGVHLRFGTVSIRQLANKAKDTSEVFLNELIWRDFYQMILWNFPQVGHGKAFRPEYDLIEWRNNETEFQQWCNGMTGYPIVDAGMRELNATGYMHNRVRMIVASFLTKDLLIDWRWGEAYFAHKLLDFDLASNNGGWQWASGSGCDAAPYFRIFNPTRQTENFDKQLKYIRKWLPELEELSYPKPMVDHDAARKRCLERYARALKR
jgi:deoxyribodipyrimidine photo-lyase